MSLPNYEQAGDLKIGQVGIANLRIRTLDIAALAEEMRQRIARAPAMFSRAAVIIDFGALAQLPSAEVARQLLAALREAGALPVALAYGSSQNNALADELGLPVLAKFRAQYEQHDTPASNTAAPARTAAEPVAAQVASSAAASEPGLMQTSSVRSGQQLYAQQRDLTVVGMVGAGAEVISDGSIHIYGPLRGRALAGARGLATARIFCREFHAELVAIAGHYKVADDFPPELTGRAVQVSLQDGELKLQLLD
ncbi:septum site-determining protein MinC [Lysobacteraceae bacterium NML120232]|nr:septum site-determining protein MinC [Xanthomonadaceae bacterium NML120232]